MSDIASELAKLHTLTGADFIIQLKLIAARSEFHPIDGETGIYATGGERGNDYKNLLNAARKAVELGYRVFLLPNPRNSRTADFIFEQRGIYKMYDLKTIQGKASASNRLLESVGQTNHVLLNVRCGYEARVLALDIRRYFEKYADAKEVMVLKGRKTVVVTRRMVSNPQFVRVFRRLYEK